MINKNAERIKKITICSSASFYKQALGLEKKLLKMGYKVATPYTAREMGKTGNFDVSSYKTWLKDASTYKRKTSLMRNHFRKVTTSDAILVVNFKKNDIEGYLGGNTLMEMAVAFYLKKPIFILNDVSKDFLLYEEIIGVNPVILNGDLSLISF